MVFRLKVKELALTGCLLLAFTSNCFGFALLGPYEDWMQITNGYRRSGDIGGPMEIGQGYRWNVPVVTYGFDQSFLDYFGSNGVAAVESAIQILNDLPPASQLLLTNYPLYPVRVNFAAQAAELFDLKTTALPLLLEQMGLAMPTRNVFDLRKFDPILSSGNESAWPTGTIPNLVIERNFDPETLLPSRNVNTSYYTAWAYSFDGTFTNWDMVEFLTNIYDGTFDSAVADWRRTKPGDFYEFVLTPSEQGGGGYFCQNLTQDDVGGLRYLLRTNNIQLETLLDDVHGTGTNAATYVNLALRPGVDKITLVRQQSDSNGRFLAMTNVFTDTYISNNSFMHQTLERVVTEPDFLFSVEDFGVSLGLGPACARTGISNWWNSASVSGSTNSVGPGVIRPPVKIIFDRPGPYIYSDGTTEPSVDWVRWGSFDGTTNPLVIYPETSGFSGADRMKIRLSFSVTGSGPSVVWQIPVSLGGEATLQTSTNLIDWVSAGTVPSIGGSAFWYYQDSHQPKLFFRALPQ